MYLPNNFLFCLSWKCALLIHNTFNMWLQSCYWLLQHALLPDDWNSWLKDFQATIYFAFWTFVKHHHILLLKITLLGTSLKPFGNIQAQILTSSNFLLTMISISHFEGCIKSAQHVQSCLTSWFSTLWHNCLSQSLLLWKKLFEHSATSAGFKCIWVALYL